jgi:hypothetical protein
MGLSKALYSYSLLFVMQPPRWQRPCSSASLRPRSQITLERAILVPVVPGSAVRVPLDGGGRRPFDLPKIEGVAGVKAYGFASFQNRDLNNTREWLRSANRRIDRQPYTLRHVTAM